VPKILVADDNTNIQKMVSLALEERGINVVSVGNGEAAVRRIPDVDPDLVLADIFMPVRNGYEVCEFVKKDERFAHVPVILLVGAFDPLDEKEARRVGADGVLKKPFVPPDPLIAMVTSALEKNPRVAAELAKAREAKAAPEPEPLPSVDLSARPEPKPLPEFPEPSPEEAELVYGFGKGHRTLDSGEPVGAEGEPPAPKLDPNTQAAHEEEADEAATSSDWRRSAMDLEIPEDLANQRAMSDLEPISFPSEKDYPPRRVRVPEPAEEVQPAAASDSKTENTFSLRQVKDSPADSADEAAELAIESPEALKLQAEPKPQPPVGVHPTIEAAARPNSFPEPNSTAVGGHWLDAVSGSQAANASGDWMQALVGGHAEPHVEAVTECPGPPESAYAGAPETEGSSEPEVAEQPIVAEPEASAADASPEPLQVNEAQDEEQHEGESFFADEAAAEEVPAAMEEANETHSDLFVQDSVSAVGEIEMETDDSDPSPALKDPALVEPPAVHVTPEPLLVEEEASAPAHYGMPAEETSPLHSFLSPTPEVPTAASSAVEHPIAAEFSVQPEAEPSEESSAEGINGRIPTMLPPNREALADIPFLTPPPSFLAEMNGGKPQEARAADAATIDVVVQKVLDRLQPQLQELLSQGLLKPLVENILQNEFDKKR
jgi:CheY-like chemotaxis protein